MKISTEETNKPNLLRPVAHTLISHQKNESFHKKPATNLESNTRGRREPHKIPDLPKTKQSNNNANQFQRGSRARCPKTHRESERAKTQPVESRAQVLPSQAPLPPPRTSKWQQHRGPLIYGGRLLLPPPPRAREFNAGTLANCGSPASAMRCDPGRPNRRCCWQQTN